MLTEAELSNFTGTEQWHKFSAFNDFILATDGAMYLAEHGGAYWLLDLIASYQHDKRMQREPFQVWTLDVKDLKGKVVCDDGNDHKLAEQIIEYTDFCLPHIKLYLCDDGNYQIVMLPSEY